VRISQAATGALLLLTTDERTGDLMHEATDADFTLLCGPVRLASREANERNTGAHRASGLDRAVGNWMTSGSAQATPSIATNRRRHESFAQQSKDPLRADSLFDTIRHRQVVSVVERSYGFTISGDMAARRLP